MHALACGRPRADKQFCHRLTADRAMSTTCTRQFWTTYFGPCPKSNAHVFRLKKKKCFSKRENVVSVLLLFSLIEPDYPILFPFRSGRKTDNLLERNPFFRSRSHRRHLSNTLVLCDSRITTLPYTCRGRVTR